MSPSASTLRRAAELRSEAIAAVRAGRLEEGRAFFRASLEYDPRDASAFLWLAGIASSEREAYQLLDRARIAGVARPQLARAVQAIHRRFAERRPQAWPRRTEAAPVHLRPPLERPKRVHRVRAVPTVPGGWPRRIANLSLRLARWLLSTAAVLVALIFFEALVVELGRGGGMSALPSAVPSAAVYTVDYVRGLAHGDMGTMASRYRARAGTPVTAELVRAFPKSVGLLAAALVLATLVGLSFGIVSALRRTQRVAGLLLFGSVIGVSTPSFFAGMLMIWFGVWFYRRTGVHFFPISGFGWDAHLVLPALVLAARPAATVTRLSHNALVDILDADYVRTAVAKGLRPRLILLRHVLRNAGVPLLTTVGVSLRFSLAVLPIVEYIFSWPGIGQRLLTAIHMQDTTTVVGMTLPLVLLFVLVNLLLEALYPLVDPRLGASEAGTV